MSNDDVTVLGYPAVIVRPSDRILVGVSASITPQYADRIKQQLNERFPDAEFTLLTGVTGMVVQRKNEAV